MGVPVKMAKTFTYSPAAALAGQVVGTEIDPAQAKPIKRGERAGNPVRTKPGNQFPGPVRVGTSKSEMVCIPTDVNGVTPAP